MPWRAWEVVNPETGLPLGDAAAWEVIAEALEQGEEVQEVVLRKPPGKIAYVMKLQLSEKGPPVYVKLQLLSGKVHARSFHYEDEPLDEDG